MWPLSLSARIASSSARVETNPSCGTVASTAFVILIYTTRSYTLAVSVCAYTRGEDERKRVAKMMKTRRAYLQVYCLFIEKSGYIRKAYLAHLRKIAAARGATNDIVTRRRRDDDDGYGDVRGA